MKQVIKAIIFDWGRTLYDSDAKKEFLDAEEVLKYCQDHAYRLAVVSLTSQHSNSTLDERGLQIEKSFLRKYFEVALVTDADKDKLFDEIVKKFGLPREQVVIVDDRIVRGIRYGTRHGHPTVWLQKGKFAQELPNLETGQPTHTIHELGELLEIIQ